MSEYRIHVSQLQPGIFIRLDVPWFDHPFLFREFKIRKEEQIAAIKEMGITTVFYVPSKSEQTPLALPPEVALEEAAADRPRAPERGREETAEDLVSALPEAPPAEPPGEVYRERMERLRTQRARFEAREAKLHEAMNRTQDVFAGFESSSGEAAATAARLVGEMVDSFLSQKEALVHLMNLQAGPEDFCHHGLSTTVLGLILGRELGLDEESMKKLGLGLLFHDIGKRYRSNKVLYTPNLLQLHPVFGVEMVSGTGRFSRESVEIVRHHHERMDGKGFPDRLPGDRLSLYVRIASIVNAFDNCCNRPDPKTSLTPNHALAYLFAREKDRFDLQILSVFIHCLGVYPPGTVVQLSDSHVGLIASVNTRNPLRPSVLVHDEGVPKEEALLLDMNDEPGLSIVKSIHPRELNRDAFAYLNPQGRMTYFFDATPPLAQP